MERDEALRLLKGGEEGIAEWNRRRESGKAIPYLDMADLSGTDLHGADLHGTDLRVADFRGADLRSSDLHRANLKGANLSGADLQCANLSMTKLGGTDLRWADLRGTDLTNARCLATAFSGVDLSGVKGLESIIHDGPSTIGTDTLFLSHGKIPEAFLRGCGLPDVLIDHISTLVGAITPIQFYSCFISYSAKDHAFAERLYSDLRGKGVRCWFAPEDLKIGEKIRVGIDESIRVHDKLLLVLTKASVESEWVEKEVETAMEKERQQRRVVLFPIRLDDAVMKVESGWPADVRRSRNIGDFREWKDHDAYSKAFDRLLRDLKAESSAARAPGD